MAGLQLSLFLLLVLCCLCEGGFFSQCNNGSPCKMDGTLKVCNSAVDGPPVRSCEFTPALFVSDINEDINPPSCEMMKGTYTDEEAAAMYGFELKVRAYYDENATPSKTTLTHSFDMAGKTCAFDLRCNGPLQSGRCLGKVVAKPTVVSKGNCDGFKSELQIERRDLLMVKARAWTEQCKEGKGLSRLLFFKKMTFLDYAGAVSSSPFPDSHITVITAHGAPSKDNMFPVVEVENEEIKPAYFKGLGELGNVLSISTKSNPKKKWSLIFNWGKFLRKFKQARQLKGPRILVLNNCNGDDSATFDAQVQKIADMPASFYVKDLKEDGDVDYVMLNPTEDTSQYAVLDQFHPAVDRNTLGAKVDVLGKSFKLFELDKILEIVFPTSPETPENDRKTVDNKQRRKSIDNSTKQRQLIQSITNSQVFKRASQHAQRVSKRNDEKDVSDDEWK